MSKRLFQNQRGEVIPGATLRTDAWWVEPLIVILLLGGFVVYATLGRAAERQLLRRPVPLALLLALPDRELRARQRAAVRLAGGSLSPAFLILWAPGGFRLTCYYYRKAYYRRSSGRRRPARCPTRAQELHRRDPLPVHPPEPPPLLLLAVAIPVAAVPLVGRDPGLPLPGRLRHRAWARSS